MHRFRLLLLPCLLLLAGSVLGNDWPQFRGPNRDGISKETGLLKTWPNSGPKLLWTSDKAGVGYSGPAVVGDRFYIMGGDKEKEYLHAHDVKTGSRIWSVEVGGFLNNDYGGGPAGRPPWTAISSTPSAVRAICFASAPTRERRSG